MPPVHNLDRKKRYHQKDINGCSLCKQKHTRCDLRRPKCYKCMLAGRECSYDIPLAKVFPEKQPSPMDPIYGNIGQPELDDPAGKRALSFFLNRTRHDLSGFTSYTERFWQTLIPQLSTTEPAFRHLALAIASRHEALSAERSKAAELEELCIREHCISLHLLSKLDPNMHADLLLLSCIAFIALERLTDITGMEARYLSYVVSGLQILRERRATSLSQTALPSSNLIDTFIEPMFLQIELMFCVFCPPASVLGEEQEWKSNRIPRIPGRFAGIKEARDSFAEICAWRYHPCLAGPIWSRTSDGFKNVWSLITDWQRSFSLIAADLTEDSAEAKAKVDSLQQQVCLLVGAILYSAEPVVASKALCYPTLVDLRTKSKLNIWVRIPSARRINLTAINGSRLCSPADIEARILPRAKRIAGDGTEDSILMEFSR